MLISVIIPVYNVEKYLKECIESVRGYPDTEMIFVDDGSTDSSGDICDSFKDENITVIHKENGGLSDARNAGLDIGPGYHQVPDGNQVHQDHDGPGVVQAEIPDVQEDRDQAAGEEHGEGDGQVHKLFAGKLPGEGIGGCQGYDHAQGGTDNGVEDGIQVAAQQLAVLENRFISHQGEIHRPDQDLGLQDRVRIRNRGDEDQPEGIKGDEQDNDPEQKIDRVEDPVLPGLPDAVLLFCLHGHNGHLSSLLSQNRLISLILRETAFTSMMMAKLMTFRHSPMAEA